MTESTHLKQFVMAALLIAFAQAASAQYFEMTAKRTTNLASTNSTILGAFPLVLPGLDEQQAVLDSITEDTKELNSLLERAEAEIDLIREYRARLIADVVTGKVDVCHLALPPGSEYLQEAGEDLESLDDAGGELGEEALAAEVAHADD